MWVVISYHYKYSKVLEDTIEGYSMLHIMEIGEEGQMVIELQSSHIIRILLMNMINKITNNTVKTKCKLTLHEILPLNKIGATECTIDGSNFLISFQPCYINHDLDMQLKVIKNNSAVIKQIMHTISIILYGIRIYYEKVLNDNLPFAETLVKEFKDIRLKIDPVNTTIYINETDPIRFGIYIQPREMIDSDMILMQYDDVDVLYKEIDKNLANIKKYIDLICIT